MSYTRTTPSLRSRPVHGLGNTLLTPVVQQVEQIVRTQVDRGVNIALDAAGDRATRYLDSQKGQALLNKFETKVETALVEVAYKRRWELVLAGISLAALTTAGVAYGSKVGKGGALIAAAVGVAAALPLVVGQQKKVV